MLADTGTGQHILKEMNVHVLPVSGCVTAWVCRAVHHLNKSLIKGQNYCDVACVHLCTWHPPRPPKHDGWQCWRVWITWGQLGEKKPKKKKRHQAPVFCEDTWLQPWNCLLLCNTAADQRAGNPAKMKSVFVSETASTDHCPLTVNELTLCFNQN